MHQARPPAPRSPSRLLPPLPPPPASALIAATYGIQLRDTWRERELILRGGQAAAVAEELGVDADEAGTPPGSVFEDGAVATDCRQISLFGGFQEDVDSIVHKTIEGVAIRQHFIFNGGSDNLHDVLPVAGGPECILS